ncbi:hypothetical protein N7539_000323 [Penicillium diatomitis]|uniref:DNA topoisomerase (ATP-hydrolyzing) n=1 Tax=Penicillium diatomitis TaxID=2819901 RepID=A0A9W9XLK1_9EURO|nr:uncharacterized protein N7539_000323 [Penicillium diatomitis]KAJ5495207.1 hypothetical protein N7539_000323 [Penicillium diatomitis]
MSQGSSSVPPASPTVEESQRLVREFIDDILINILDQVSLSPSESRPSITLRRRSNQTQCTINSQTRALEARLNDVTYHSYSWPGRTPFESWKFTVIIRILSIIDEAICTEQLISKRDIYYIDPAYFKSQATVNAVVDDLAFTIGVDRTFLNIEAASKGLVAGRFQLERESRVIVDASSGEDTMIPRVQGSDTIDIEGVRWVFIIEKEAVFHRLARSNYPKRAISGDGILITGKGYPDVSTREFAHQLFIASRRYDRPPHFYALMDSDPHGMAIMSTYKYGSMAHLHENARLSLPGLEWLGVRLTDAILASESPGAGRVLSLTANDRRKILAMLRKNPVWASDGPEREWVTELHRMLLLNVKAEIEILYEREGGLEAWIDRKLFRQE